MLQLQERLFSNLPRPKYFLVIRGGTHFSFNNRFSDSPAAMLMSGTETQFNVICRYSIAFLEKHLLGKTEADQVLALKDPMLSEYLHEP